MTTFDLATLRVLANALADGKHLTAIERHAYAKVVARSLEELEHVARVRDTLRDWLDIRTE